MTKIKHLINYDRMKEYLNAPIDWFHRFGRATQTEDGVLIHSDIGANVLAVAHLDSVNDEYHFYVNQFASHTVVFSTHLDDRLGAYVVLELLPQMGIHTDILLTEGEEIGKSTAKHFLTNKKYKWMFSFDRRGEDVVHYRYTPLQWKDALKKTWGAQIFYGSNSDINYLSHLGCCGVNVGTGYHDEHHLMAYADMTELVKQLGRFTQFYQTNKRTHFPFTNPPPPPKYTPPVHYQPAAPSYAEPPPPPLAAKPSLPTGRQDIVVDVEVEEDYNPYDGMHTDVPLDMELYIGPDGVLNAPFKCAFCLERLASTTVNLFMGICAKCEKWAVECLVCGEYYCRTDEPSEDMGEELFYGVCLECLESARFKPNENTRLQTTSNEREHEDADGDGQGDEGNVSGGSTGTG